jgi:hypothetical protein
MEPPRSPSHRNRIAALVATLASGVVLLIASVQGLAAIDGDLERAASPAADTPQVRYGEGDGVTTAPPPAERHDGRCRRPKTEAKT